MAGNASDDGSDNFSWNTDDEQEIDGSTFDATRALTGGDVENHHRFCEASTSADPSNTNLFLHFEAMGFSRNLVAKAIEENGEGNAESILETLLTYGVLERFSQRENSTETPPMIEQDDDSDLQIDADSGAGSSDYQENLLEDLSDPDSCSGIEMKPTSLPDKDQRVSFLEDMGYPTEEVAIAIARSRPEASIEELADYICAAQMARAADFAYVDPPTNEKVISNILLHVSTALRSHIWSLLYAIIEVFTVNGWFTLINFWKRLFILQKHLYGKHKKRRLDFESSRVKRQGSLSTEDESIRLPKPMIGFGIPTGHCPAVHRKLPEAAIGPPYFYYENVALAPKGVWDTISRFLYEVEPEFVDSKHFCAAARKRGYVHNLPIDKRFPLLPFPPRTIHEALPLTRRWWPSWDERTKLNCLQTSIASAKLTDRIRKALEEWEADPPLHVQKFVLEQCRKWNLVWVGRNKAAPLEPDEVEMLLGFPKNHTRGGGISRTDRFKSLGNSFQVDTVAYHLSVLKGMFPDGLNLLSLFSGIGGAEVALHRLGVRLKVVVSVEISEVNRNIVRSWWEQTNQKGTLIDLPDVQQLTEDRLEELIDAFGGFDLVVGGSPCNNLAGGNRVSRDGLEGKESALFYDYFRILHSVKLIMEMKVKKQ